jgi:hypothetical protein
LSATKIVNDADNGSGAKLQKDVSIFIEFAADDRSPAEKIRRRVTSVLYLAKPADPVDIAVLAIEPNEVQTPLTFSSASAAAPNNLFVVGHPALLAGVPAQVKAVFGNPDGRKRVSFGKRLSVKTASREMGHDASTIGGFSGGPVVGISSGLVAGLHYYGDPASGNLAITADAIRAHGSYEFLAVASQ